MRKYILIVEDDMEIKTLIQFFLEKDELLGRNYEILTTQSGSKALSVIQEKKPEILILDIMLPEISGFEIAKKIRTEKYKYGDPLILMLTAKTEIEDLVNGFETGCDDYLKKPFDPRELILRIKKLISLKHDSPSQKNEELKYLQIKVSLSRHSVYEGEREVTLSNKEFKLLVYLIENMGIVLTREKILNKVWGENYFSGDRTIDVYIGKLREKLPSLLEHIKTVKGVGYRLKEI